MIPYENFSQLSSQAYFSYEMDLYLFDPVVSRMVSERYRCAINSDEDEDPWASDSDSVTDEDEDSASDEDEDSTASMVSDCAEPEVEEEISVSDIVFGSFGDSNLNTMILIKQIKPAIDGGFIKIGEIICFLPVFEAVDVLDLHLPNLITDRSELVFYGFEHHHTIFGIAIADHVASIVNYLNLVSTSLDSVKRSSETIAIVDTLEPQIVTNVDTVESDFVFSDLHGTDINVFDPGGASTGTVSIIESHIWLIDHHAVWIVIFDPGGNRRQPPWILLYLYISPVVSNTPEGSNLCFSASCFHSRIILQSNCRVAALSSPSYNSVVASHSRFHLVAFPSQCIPLCSCFASRSRRPSGQIHHLRSCARDWKVPEGVHNRVAEVLGLLLFGFGLGLGLY